MRKIILCFLLITFRVSASDSCENIQLSDQIFSCAKNKYAASDALLNKSYKELMAKIAKDYKSKPDLKADFIGKVKISQRAWIIFRDTNCLVYSYQIDPQSQAYETSLYLCKIDMTNQRVVEINKMLMQ
ncbi:lysozyme inhibitor LprI family protein [Siccibacter colletis]|uniref:lysozyme inhibitor LprI family protein n=1 Tax=Siccibacter colletis TaxID=1505757 RepID=UPI0004E0FA31|nr:lysozyme inhibitor LprI family protein [Siccibacter colletis]